MIDKIGALGKIFIAGTGRCGTTILHTILGRHPQAYQIPFEPKFIVEGDGLNALLPRPHEDYSVTASDLALIRFIEMMNENASRFSSLLGAQYYFPPLQEYIDNLTGFVYDGHPFPKNFQCREDLVAVTRHFVSTMFGAPTLNAGKTFWVKKTPSSIIAMDLIWELFPEAIIIHITRDPRGVLFSLLQQDWMPQELRNTTSFLSHIYWRWKQLRPRLKLESRRNIEIKFEDLCRHPHETMSVIAKLADVSHDFDLGIFNPIAVERWRTEMPAEQREFAEEKLASYFSLMGYDLAAPLG